MTKTILITGATDGIGLLTAKTLHVQGHTLILHGRSPQKLQAAASDLGGETQQFVADLSSLEDTKKMVADVLQRVDHLDVLINNAGVLKTADPVLPNGQDVRFVVNTLAPYVLAQGLLPIMPHDGRILNLSSAAQAPVDITALKGGVALDHMAAYAQSKRAITLWSYAMAQAHPAGPAVISVNPGSLLASKMVKEGFGIAGHDLEIGAGILRQIALAPNFANASGKYWDNDSGQFGHFDTSQTQDVMAAIAELI